MHKQSDLPRHQSGQIATILTLIAMGLMSLGIFVGTVAITNPASPLYTLYTKAAGVSEIFQDIPSGFNYHEPLKGAGGDPNFWQATERKTSYDFITTICRLDDPDVTGFKMEFSPQNVIPNFYPDDFKNSLITSVSVQPKSFNFATDFGDKKCLTDELILSINMHSSWLSSNKAAVLYLRACYTYGSGSNCKNQGIILGELPSEVIPTPTHTPTPTITGQPTNTPTPTVTTIPTPTTTVTPTPTATPTVTLTPAPSEVTLISHTPPAWSDSGYDINATFQKAGGFTTPFDGGASGPAGNFSIIIGKEDRSSTRGFSGTSFPTSPEESRSLATSCGANDFCSSPSEGYGPNSRYFLRLSYNDGSRKECYFGPNFKDCHLYGTGSFPLLEKGFKFANAPQASPTPTSTPTPSLTSTPTLTPIPTGADLYASGIRYIGKPTIGEDLPIAVDIGNNGPENVHKFYRKVSYYTKPGGAPDSDFVFAGILFEETSIGFLPAGTVDSNLYGGKITNLQAGTVYKIKLEVSPPDPPNSFEDPDDSNNILWSEEFAPTCPYDVDAFICLDNNNDYECDCIDGRCDLDSLINEPISYDYTLANGKSGTNTFSNGFVSYHVNPLNPDLIDPDLNNPITSVTLRPPGHWQIKQAFCKDNNELNSCPANLGAQATFKIGVGCHVDHDYGWILEKTCTDPSLSWSPPSGTGEGVWQDPWVERDPEGNVTGYKWCAVQTWFKPSENAKSFKVEIWPESEGPTSGRYQKKTFTREQIADGQVDHSRIDQNRFNVQFLGVDHQPYNQTWIAKVTAYTNDDLTGCSKSIDEDWGLHSSCYSQSGGEPPGGQPPIPGCTGECIYSQAANECYRGNCLDTSQPCDFNDNCGYVVVEGQRCPSGDGLSGDPIACPGQPSACPEGWTDYYTLGNCRAQGNCWDANMCDDNGCCPPTSTPECQYTVEFDCNYACDVPCEGSGDCWNCPSSTPECQYPDPYNCNYNCDLDCEQSEEDPDCWNCPSTPPSTPYCPAACNPPRCDSACSDCSWCQPSLGTISGTVTVDINIPPGKYLMVDVYDESRSYGCDFLNQDGEYRIANIPAGQKAVTLLASLFDTNTDCGATGTPIPNAQVTAINCPRQEGPACLLDVPVDDEIIQDFSITIPSVTGIISGKVTITTSDNNFYDKVTVWKCDLNDPNDPSKGHVCNEEKVLYDGADRDDSHEFDYRFDNLTDGQKYVIWANVKLDGFNIAWSYHDRDCPSAPALDNQRKCVVTATEDGTIQDFNLIIAIPDEGEFVGEFVGEFADATTVDQACIPNGAVDEADLTILLGNYFTQGAPGAVRGDVTGDGRVAADDLSLLIAHFGETVE